MEHKVFKNVIGKMIKHNCDQLFVSWWPMRGPKYFFSKALWLRGGKETQKGADSHGLKLTQPEIDQPKIEVMKTISRRQSFAAGD